LRANNLRPGGAILELLVRSFFPGFRVRIHLALGLSDSRGGSLVGKDGGHRPRQSDRGRVEVKRRVEFAPLGDSSRDARLPQLDGVKGGSILVVATLTYIDILRGESLRFAPHIVLVKENAAPAGLVEPELPEVSGLEDLPLKELPGRHVLRLVRAVKGEARKPVLVAAKKNKENGNENGGGGKQGKIMS